MPGALEVVTHFPDASLNASRLADGGQWSRRRGEEEEGLQVPEDKECDVTEQEEEAPNHRSKGKGKAPVKVRPSSVSFYLHSVMQLTGETVCPSKPLNSVEKRAPSTRSSIPIDSDDVRRLTPSRAPC